MAEDNAYRGDRPAAQDDARQCPNPSDAKSISQNEPKLDGARRDATSACPEMSDIVRKRPIQNPKMQNEPTAGAAAATTPPIDPALKLSPRQLEAINLLFAGKSFGAVSTELRVAARTLTFPTIGRRGGVN